ncbi:MAG: NAD(P)/FAD-dependent oxidoreductase [Actinocrinis sp.]
MSERETLVIVGAGLAGAKAAQALRERGFTGRLMLFGEETHLPYERPPLSKGYLAGSAERDSMLVHAGDWYSQQEVELRLGRRVTGLDRAGHLVQLAGGEQVRYDRLLLATGARPRSLPVPGAESQGVYSLRTVGDSDRLRAMLADGARAAGSRLVIIGGGWIGLEVAAAARQAGWEVTVVETGALPLLAALGPQAAAIFAQLHRDHGVGFRFDATVTEIRTEQGAATGVALGTRTGGEVLPADAVLVAIGASPNTDLAAAAGLDVDNGVLTDAGLRSSDPDIFAAGDVANALHPFYGHRVRVEHWANALNQPQVAAASMLDEPNASYDRLPYFYTDQYDLGMEYVGLLHRDESGGAGYDEMVVRGDVARREFVAFWLRERRVVAGMAVNIWDMIDPIRELIVSRATVDAASLTDPAVELSASAR